MRDEIDRYLDRRGSTNRAAAIAALVRRTCRAQQQHTQRLIEARLAQLGISVARAVQDSRPLWPGASVTLATVSRSARGSAAAAAAAAAIVALGLWRWSGSEPSQHLAQEQVALTPSPAPGSHSAPVPLGSKCPTAPQPQRLVRLELSVEPPGAALYLDGQRLSSNPIDARLVLDSRPHTLRAAADGYAELVSSFHLDSDLRLDAELRPLKD
jgi:hypothetical protein